MNSLHLLIIHLMIAAAVPVVPLNSWWPSKTDTTLTTSNNSSRTVGTINKKRRKRRGRWRRSRIFRMTQCIQLTTHKSEGVVDTPSPSTLKIKCLEVLWEVEGLVWVRASSTSSYYSVASARVTYRLSSTGYGDYATMLPAPAPPPPAVQEELEEGEMV